jgi:hypothetical protein
MGQDMSDRCPTTGLACSVAYRRKGCRCTPCKVQRAKAERHRLPNRRLDALEQEFIEAVRVDSHYIVDIVKAWNRLPARKRRAEKE